MLGDMARPDPWLEHYGAARGALAARSPQAHRPRPGVGRADRRRGRHRRRPPRPRAGARRAELAFHACTHGHRLAARCTELRVPADPARPAGRTHRAARRGHPGHPAAGARGALLPRGRAGRRGERRRGQGGRGVREASASSATSCSSISAGRALARARVPAGTRARDRRRAVAAYVRRCFEQLGDEARLLTSEAAADDIERVRRGARLRARSTSSAAPTAATLAQLYLRRHRGLGAHADARRRLALERPDLRAGRPQRRARAARGHRALPGARIAVRSGVPGHRGRARPRARRAARDARRDRDDDRGAPAHARERGSRPAARAPGGRRAAPAARARARGARGRRARCPLAPGDGLDDPVRRVVGARRRGRDGQGRAARASSRTPPWRARGSSGRSVRASRTTPRAAAPESSDVPVLLLAGSADPLDPPANLRGWRAAVPERRARHRAGPGATASSPTAACGCWSRASSTPAAPAGLDAGCARHVPLPRFELT